MENILSVGDIVKIVSDCQTTGLTGKIVKMADSNMYATVLIDKIGEQRTYYHKSLELVCENSSRIADNNLDYVVVKIKFITNQYGTRLYDFACYDKSVKIGDIVICDTSNGFISGEVKSIISRVDNGLKSIVQIVDFTEYKKRIEKQNRKKSLESKMNNIVKQVEKDILYKTIAETNDDFAKLLEEYKGL